MINVHYDYQGKLLLPIYINFKSHFFVRFNIYTLAIDHVSCSKKFNIFFLIFFVFYNLYFIEMYFVSYYRNPY